MERDFYNEDIEQLIKQKADQYKMYPSDKVWKGIDRSLHPRRKWYWLSFVLFLGAISYYTIMDMIAPPRNGSLANAKNPASQNTSASQPEKQAVVIPFVNSGKDHTSKAGTPAKKTIAPSIDAQPAQENLAPVTAPENYTSENNPASETRDARIYDFRTGRLKEDLLSAVPAEKLSLVADNDYSVKHNVEQPAADVPSDIKLKITEEAATGEDSKRINWLAQNAVYELEPPAMKRLSWQLSFSPTMNYRKLGGNDFTRVHNDIKNVPIAPNIKGDPDELVRHKPALGLEIGSHFIYSLNKTFAVRAGFQFNYSRYDIQAYTSYVTEDATIALNSTSRRNSSDSITNPSNLRNFGGDAVQELRNQYFQFSIPVGIEWRLLGNDKLQIGVAGTIAPTYLMNRNTYLITTDFKNYTQEPTLLRRWNLNTSAEAFIAYKTGDLKWQVGPQFRYQLLSSYIREYPITEHLMEFGIKIGVAKTIR